MKSILIMLLFVCEIEKRKKRFRYPIYILYRELQSLEEKDLSL